ncbi:MAG: ThuA domain-containing protein [Bryobacterales bacterium]|nr:ThuA domain-containing protein [Bryobacterales bacterium]
MRILISLLAAAAFASEPSHFFAPGKLRVLILSGRNNHDWRSTTPFLARLLESTGRFDVRITEEPTALNPAALEPYQVLVSDYSGPRWSPAAEQAVEAFLRSGKGLVATHAATYAFGDMEILGDRHFRTGIHEPPWPDYAQIIGARWSDKDPKSGHGKRHLFRVQITDRTHPITEGLEPTFPISDELYHNLRLAPGAHVLATAFDAPGQNGTGRNEPIAWTTSFGGGRVFYTALGHDTAALSAPGFAAMFTRAALWAAGAAPAPTTPAEPPVRVTLVTGGHSHDPGFYSVFDNNPAIRVTVNPHPVAYRGDLRKSTDVLVLYDMVQEVPEDQRRNLTQFLESGKGLVVLHHALMDFNSWEWWWRDVMAGRYLEKPDRGQPASTFLHDVDIDAKPAGDHPILRGIPPMLIHDETYKHMWISKDAQVLLETTHPTSDGPLAWISPYEKSRVVVIQLGHGPEAHRHPSYRHLVHNAILWAAGK